MMGLTPKMRSAYDFIASRLRHDGVAPSLREIAEAIGYSSKSVSRTFEILTALERRGHIRRLKGHARAIELVPENPLPSLSADIRLKPEIFQLATQYAREHNITLETAANALLRDALEAA